MAEMLERSVGKCPEGHLGSYGFPSRPAEPYEFCPQCGQRMIWMCASCGEPVPDDPQELAAARFCRSCGAPYFEIRPVEPQASAEPKREGPA